ncbi:MAG: hypothetical protein ACRET0_14460, partial [Steroidobacteraceae bacterium]
MKWGDDRKNLCSFVTTAAVRLQQPRPKPSSDIEKISVGVRPTRAYRVSQRLRYYRTCRASVRPVSAVRRGGTHVRRRSNTGGAAGMCIAALLLSRFMEDTRVYEIEVQDRIGEC